VLGVWHLGQGVVHPAVEHASLGQTHAHAAVFDHHLAAPLAKRRPARLKSQFGIAHTEVQAEAASRRRSILADRSLVLEITLLDGAAANRRSESTRLNSSHVKISYAVFCLKKKKN